MPQRAGAQMSVGSVGSGTAGIWPSVSGQGGDPRVHEGFTEVGDESQSPELIHNPHCSSDIHCAER